MGTVINLDAERHVRQALFRILDALWDNLPPTGKISDIETHRIIGSIIDDSALRRTMAIAADTITSDALRKAISRFSQPPWAPSDVICDLWNIVGTIGVMDALRFDESDRMTIIR